MKKIERTPPPLESSSSTSSRSLKERDLILYVEDEDENWAAAELLLKRRYDVLRARNAREACAAFLEHKDRLTAILMDIQLQGSDLDGIELTMLLRGNLPRTSLPTYASAIPRLDLPVLFVTAYGSRYSEADLIVAGGDRLILKPIDFVQLSTTILELKFQRVGPQRRG